MQAQTLKVPPGRDGHAKWMGIVGPLPMVLLEEYDPDQYWLPFMQGVVLKNVPRHPLPDYCNSEWRKVIHDRINDPVWMPPGCRCLYEHLHLDSKFDNEQRLLPFREAKRVEPREYRTVNHLWDKAAGGSPKHPEPLRYTVRGCKDTGEFLEWCLDNLRGRFVYNQSSLWTDRAGDVSLIFELFSDWLFIKMKFDGAQAA